MVRYRDTLRPIWIPGSRRGSVLVRSEDGQRSVARERAVMEEPLTCARRVILPDFDKANEILFRLGIIYKQQGKYSESLECFDRILRNPPSPLAHADIWFQIGHVFEQQRDVRILFRVVPTAARLTRLSL